jgi:hypothetical protein
VVTEACFCRGSAPGRLGHLRDAPRRREYCRLPARSSCSLTAIRAGGENAATHFTLKCRRTMASSRGASSGGPLQGFALLPSRAARGHARFVVSWRPMHSLGSGPPADGLRKRCNANDGRPMPCPTSRFNGPALALLAPAAERRVGRQRQIARSTKRCGDRRDGRPFS